jgi:nitric oxide reductase large subunit
VLLAWYVSVAGSVAVEPQPGIRLIALFVHLASVVVGLGAAVMVEYNGLLWIRGTRSVGAVNDAEHTLSFVVWVGIVGLLLSGLFLHPDLANPWTDLKLLAVLVLALNGVAVTNLANEMRRLPPDLSFRRTPGALRRWAVRSGVISQVAWWTAVLIGMLNTASR